MLSILGKNLSRCHEEEGSVHINAYSQDSELRRPDINYNGLLCMQTSYNLFFKMHL